MKEVIVGAVIAGLIGFLTAVLALTMQEGVTQLSDISQLAWVVALVGSAISFLKDFQAIWTRKKLAQVTGSKNVH